MLQGGAANALEERAPDPPVFRRGDERRERLADPELCEFCQRHPRKPASQRGGPRPKHCAHVWGRDHRGKDVTCARLDDAHDLWLAVYGGSGPLSDLDVAAQARHVADLRAALDTLFAALDPVRGDLTQLDQRLTSEVAVALQRAEQAAAELEQGRRDVAAATAARDQEAEARRQADDRADEARRNEGAALVERDEHRQARRLAEDRERDANTRAQAALDTAKEANKTVAEQASQIGELTGANRELTARAEALAAELDAARTAHDQQLAQVRAKADADMRDARQKAETELREAGEKAHADLERAREKAQIDLAAQRITCEQRLAEADRAATARITELTAQLATATATATTATATLEETATARDRLARQHARLREAVLELAAEPDAADLRDALRALLRDPDTENGRQP